LGRITLRRWRFDASRRVRERRKTVTRRLSWKVLRAGGRLILFRKLMGLRLSERIVQITPVRSPRYGVSRWLSTWKMLRPRFPGLDAYRLIEWYGEQS